MSTKGISLVKFLTKKGDKMAEPDLNFDLPEVESEVESVDIMFSDLTEEAQKMVLGLYGYNHPNDGNFDIFPLFTLEYYPENSEDTV